MKTGVAQIRCSPGDILQNCSKVKSFALQAKEQGCGIAVFPELVDTGYDLSLIPQAASTWSEYPFTFLQNIASDFDLYLICGISEKDRLGIYNSIAVISPQGELVGKYRKTHLFSSNSVCEDSCFLSGDSLETVDIEDMTWGLSICFDLRFPELSRSLLLKGADVLVVCSAWPMTRVLHWKTLTAARAIENQAYVIASNRVGTDGILTFCGSSCIVDPMGRHISSIDEYSEGLIVGEVSKANVSSVRELLPVCSSRREDLY